MTSIKKIFLPLFLILILLAIGGVGAFCYQSQSCRLTKINSEKNNLPVNDEQEIQLVAATDENKTSFVDLMAQAATAPAEIKKCTWIETIDQDVTTGMVIVKGNQLYSKIELNNPSRKQVRYSLRDEQWLYTWMEKQNNGQKILLSSLNTDNYGAKAYLTAMEQKRPLNCETWSGGEKYLLPPKNITFKEVPLVTSAGNIDKNLEQNQLNNYCQNCANLKDLDKAMCEASCQAAPETTINAGVQE